MDYGKAIRMARAARGINQRTLAKRIRLDPSYVSLLEKNRRTPSTETLEAISRALEIPVYLLMLFASEPKDLRGISSAQASELAKRLLRVVTMHE